MYHAALVELGPRDSAETVRRFWAVLEMLIGERHRVMPEIRDLGLGRVSLGWRIEHPDLDPVPDGDQVPTFTVTDAVILFDTVPNLVIDAAP